MPGLLRETVARSRKAAATKARKAADGADRGCRPGRPGAGRPAPRPPRPAVRLRRPGVAWPTTPAPGVRVKVRFAGQDVDGFVVERRADTDHTGRLTPLRRLVSTEPVLTPAVAALTEDVARRYAGTRSDVLRLAVPPRHATTEKQPSPRVRPSSRRSTWPPPSWHGRRTPRRRRTSATWPTEASPRAVWSAGPGTDWPALVAHAVAATRASGRGALVVRARPRRRRPGRRSAARPCSAQSQHVVLTADAGPGPALPGVPRRRAEAAGGSSWAPGPRRSPRCHDLGLVVIWDDGDDLHAEPRAPYPHAREVLLTRARARGHGGPGRRVRPQRGGAAAAADRLGPAARAGARAAPHPGADRDRRRRRPQPRPGPARPRRAAAQRGAPAGPGRAGRADPCSCRPRGRATPPRSRAARCRTPARCAACHGPLALASATAPPSCRWCGTAAERVGLPGVRGPRAARPSGGRGSHRRGARPGLPRRRRPRLGRRPGADRGGRRRPRSSWRPRAPSRSPTGGYAAVVLLDTWLTLGLAHLRADEEALRRWSNAVGLVRPGGRAIAVGDPAHPALQALVRWDHAGFAEREAEARSEAHLPPASRLATADRRPGRGRRRAHPAGAARGHRGARPGPASTVPSPDRSGRWSACPGSRVSPCPTPSARCSGSARRASSTPVRIQVDPLTL